jgi:hydroxymethylpyrimidine/phosphomethylpyrimidine kinase
MTTTTALTAQNTQGVHGIHHTPPSFVAKQIEACISDIGVDVVKTGLSPPFLTSLIDFGDLNICVLTEIGMLASAETIRVVADALCKHKVMTTVVDPV